MSKLDVAYDVAARLGAAEQAIEEALRTGAELMARLSTARREMGLSMVLGGEAVSRSSAALSALAVARAETAACHDALSLLKVRAGLGAVAIGDGDKPAPPESTEAIERPVAGLRRLRTA